MMVGTERLELSHLAALEPKSSASTNFATSPRGIYIMEIISSSQHAYKKTTLVVFNENESRFYCTCRLVGTERLELSHLAALEPKSSASTNFATSPMAVYIIEIISS